MKNTKIIKKKYEFKVLYIKGKILYGKNITIYYNRSKKEYNRLAVAVPKKSGKAVKRNYIKRIIKENYIKIEKNLKTGYNILISVNKKCKIENVNFYIIKNDLQNILEKSEMWIN